VGEIKMKRPRFLYMVIVLGLFSVSAELSSLTSFAEIIDTSHQGKINEQIVTTVTPREIDDVLYNPGIGFADFHFGFGDPPSLDEYPRQTVAYFRWAWAELEPEEGQYNFAFIDEVIRQARAKGETLGFRVMTEYRSGSPRWLLEKGVASVQAGSGAFPDYNSPIFLQYHEKLIQALGERYSGSPDIDHVDIGTVGCWGEWNTACCETVKELCGRYYPTEENQRRITDMYLRYFPKTPLIMLIGGQPKYAVERGAGWRGDCLGDYGMFFEDWNHMDDLYGPAAQDQTIGSAWKTAPVHLEVCYYIQNWYERGYDVDTILSKALEWHASVINAKSKPIPAVWRPRVDEFLKRLGYRLVIRNVRHSTVAEPGGQLFIASRWENVGVAPMYHNWPLAYRLRSDSGEIVGQWMSQADTRQWLPGASHEVKDSVQIALDIPLGTYSLDVAILDRDGGSAHVALAVEGGRADLWHAVSQVVVAAPQ
jgi:uncharacterized protein DUF4832/glycosyl hydrolase family 42 (putative beta-galactosidase)